MTLTRLMPFDARSGLLIALGTGVLLAPVALLLSSAAIVTGLVAGIVTTGTGIAGTATRGRGTVPLLAHKACDRFLAAGLGFAAAAFAATGEPVAAAILGTAGAAQLLICANTRYSAASG